MLNKAGTLFFNPRGLGKDAFEQGKRFYNRYSSADDATKNKILARGLVTTGEGLSLSLLTRGAAASVSELSVFAKVPENPLKRSLGLFATRRWYIAQVRKIPSLLDENLSLREKALKAFSLRNEFKMQARDLMKNQRLVKRLPAPADLKKLVRKSYINNEVGDKMWQEILESSLRTNSMVDRLMGVRNPYSKKR